MPVFLGPWQQAACFRDSFGIHLLASLGRSCPPSPGTSHAGTAAPLLLSLEIRWRVENKKLSTPAPPHAARQGLLPPLCPRSCHHGSGSAPHNLDGCFISMATFLLKHFRGSLVLLDNEGSSVSHSVTYKKLRETTLTPLPTSFPPWQAVPALVQRAAGLVPAACSPFPCLQLCSPLSSRRLPFCWQPAKAPAQTDQLKGVLEQVDVESASAVEDGKAPGELYRSAPPAAR